MESFIEKFVLLHRDILHDFTFKLGSIEDEEFKIRFMNYYYFESTFTWNIFMNCVYIFDDTELAKNSFIKFMLQGPCRHEDLGERYLRLYGFLNLVYMQKNAIENFIEIFKIPNLKKIKKDLNNLDLILLRNKIASHPSNYKTDYINDTKNKFLVYEISRNHIVRDEILLLRDQEYFEEYDLLEITNSFNYVIENLLNQTLCKFIKKKFNNQGDFYKKLILLQAEINGDIVINEQIIKKINTGKRQL